MVLSMDRWVGKVAVVTGASSGIGAAIAENLVGKGIKVVGLARRKEKMEELANKLSGKKGKFYPIQTDITKEEEILKAFKWIKDNLGPIHILVNNAGVVKIGKLTEGDTEAWDQVFKVNVFGLLIATREAVKDMKANQVDGHIIHINAVLGHQVLNLPDLNAYPASKFAVTAKLRIDLSILPRTSRARTNEPNKHFEKKLAVFVGEAPVFTDAKCGINERHGQYSCEEFYTNICRFRKTHNICWIP